VDNAVAAEEFSYTVAHELRERNLMAHKKISYEDAHRLALDLEHSLRRADDSSAREHEKGLRMVPPTDCYNVKEIASLPDSISLQKEEFVLCRPCNRPAQKSKTSPYR